jgi:hypothetical protein
MAKETENLEQALGELKEAEAELAALKKLYRELPGQLELAGRRFSEACAAFARAKDAARREERHNVV